MKRIALIPLTAIAAPAAVLAIAAGAHAKDSSSTSTAAPKSFHGTVASVSTADRTFRLRRPSGAILLFRVTATTRYERVGGRLATLAGRSVEVKARRVDGVWRASRVESAPRGTGEDAGGHGAGDDHGGHGADG